MIAAAVMIAAVVVIAAAVLIAAAVMIAAAVAVAASVVIAAAVMIAAAVVIATAVMIAAHVVVVVVVVVLLASHFGSSHSHFGSRLDRAPMCSIACPWCVSNEMDGRRCSLLPTLLPVRCMIGGWWHTAVS